MRPRALWAMRAFAASLAARPAPLAVCIQSGAAAADALAAGHSRLPGRLQAQPHARPADGVRRVPVRAAGARRRTPRGRALLWLVSLLAAVNVLFMVPGRTGYVVLGVLALYLGYRLRGARGLALASGVARSRPLLASATRAGLFHDRVRTFVTRVPGVAAGRGQPDLDRPAAGVLPQFAGDHPRPSAARRGHRRLSEGVRGQGEGHRHAARRAIRTTSTCSSPCRSASSASPPCCASSGCNGARAAARLAAGAPPRARAGADDRDRLPVQLAAARPHRRTALRLAHGAALRRFTIEARHRDT